MKNSVRSKPVFDWVDSSKEMPSKGTSVLVWIQESGVIRSAVADPEYSGGFRYKIASGSFFCTGPTLAWVLRPRKPSF